MYGAALDGLWELEAIASAGILIQAKEVLFGIKPVPVDRGQRLRLMPNIENDAAPEHQQLEELDKAFWADTEKLGERCKVFANKHGLYTDG